jgi:hypothetical protein
MAGREDHHLKLFLPGILELFCIQVVWLDLSWLKGAVGPSWSIQTCNCVSLTAPLLL